MHIKVLKTWCGIEGMFIKDAICEVDDAVLKKIGNKRLGNEKRLHYEEVPAPWDAQKDEKAVRVTDLQGRIAKAAVELERLEDELLNMQFRAGPSEGSAVGVIEYAEDVHDLAEQHIEQVTAQAEEAAETFADKPTEANKKKAAELAAQVDAAARVENDKSWLVMKAQAQLLLLNADIDLTELEVVDAKAELAAMQAELYELRPDLKPKEDEDGPTEKTEGPDGPGQPGGKDAADAEGQTDAAGQANAVQS